MTDGSPKRTTSLILINLLAFVVAIPVFFSTYATFVHRSWAVHMLVTCGLTGLAAGVVVFIGYLFTRR